MVFEPRYIDVHAHAYEFRPEEIAGFASEGILIVGVSDDLESSKKSLRYGEMFSNFIPAVGVHPWKASEVSNEEVERVIALSHKAKIIGEVGLDTRFVPQTLKRQQEIFLRFVEVAAEMNYPMNLHTAGTWEEVLKIVSDAGVRRAVFHWYTGPLHLLREIEAQGYFVSINPAVLVQKKHRRVVQEAPLEIILTESDGPYNYRGMVLSPEMVPRVVREIAEIKETEEEEVLRVVKRNFEKLFDGFVRRSGEGHV